MTVNKLWLRRETLTDGGHVFDGTANLDLQFVTEDDALAFMEGLRDLVAKHTNNNLDVRYNPDHIARDAQADDILGADPDLYTRADYLNRAHDEMIRRGIKGLLNDSDRRVLLRHRDAGMTPVQAGAHRAMDYLRQ